MKKTKKAFSLTELLVITVLIIILAASGFVYYKNYPLEARDSVRIKDMKETVKNSLELYKSTTGEYPLPTNAKLIELDGKKWLSGEFGEEMVGKIKWLEKLPLDPKTKKPYKYLLSENGINYKIISTLETTGKEHIVTNEKTNTLAINNNYSKKNCTLEIGGQIETVYDQDRLILYKNSSSTNCEQEKGIIICDNGILKLENPISPETINDYTNYNYKTCTKTNETGDCLASNTNPGIINIGGHTYKYTENIKNNKTKSIESESIESKSFYGYLKCKTELKCIDGKIISNSKETCELTNCLLDYYLDPNENTNINIKGKCKTSNCKSGINFKSPSLKTYKLKQNLKNTKQIELKLKLKENNLIKNTETSCTIKLKCDNGILKEIPINNEECITNCISGYKKDSNGNCIEDKNCNSDKHTGLKSKHIYEIPAINNGETKEELFILSNDSGKKEYKLTSKCVDGKLSNKETYIGLTCNYGYHKETSSPNKCLPNIKKVNCKQEGGPIDTNSFDYIEKEIEIKWQNNKWEEVENCAWSCKVNYEQVGSDKCINYCDFGGLDHFDGCVINDTGGSCELLGKKCQGGLYAGEFNGKKIVTTPGGCGSDPSNPGCNLGTDTLEFNWNDGNNNWSDTNAKSNTDGKSNTQTILSGHPNHKAAKYCNNLVYGFDIVIGIYQLKMN